MSSPCTKASWAASVALLGAAVVGSGFGKAAGQEPYGKGTPKADAKFTAAGQTLNLPKTVPTLSGDGVVVTHLIQDLAVEVGGAPLPDAGGRGGFPEADSRSASIFSVLAKHEKPVYVRQTLTGHVDLQPGVEGAVLLQSCGKTTLVPLPKSGADDFKAEVVGPVQAGCDYLATICVVVQRGSRDRGVQGFLTIDSLELTIVDPPASKE